MKNLLVLTVLFICTFSYSQLPVLKDTTIKGKVKLLTHYRHDKDNPEVKVNRFDVYYDQNGLITHAIRKTEKIEYQMLKRTYDANDQLIEEIHFGGQGDTSVVYTYEYGEYGITKETNRSKYGGPSGYTYVYNENGKLIKKRSYREYNGHLMEYDHSSYEYNEAGELVRWLNGDHGVEWTIEDGVEIGINKHRGTKEEKIYDENGRLTKYIGYHAKEDHHGHHGDHHNEHEKEELEEMEEAEEIYEEPKEVEYEVYNVLTYEYNEMGHPVVMKTEMEGYKTAPIYKYKYDDQGNIISYQEISTRWGEERILHYWTREIEYYK